MASTARRHERGPLPKSRQPTHKPTHKNPHTSPRQPSLERGTETGTGLMADDETSLTKPERATQREWKLNLRESHATPGGPASYCKIDDERPCVSRAERTSDGGNKSTENRAGANLLVRGECNYHHYYLDEHQQQQQQQQDLQRIPQDPDDGK